jgi:ABC-type antimicrobial peptide transport system permease subunit
MMDCMFIRVAPDNMSATVKYIESTCKQINPAYPLRYMFFDEWLGRLYRNEQRMGRIVGYFTFLAIAISCLGLFGMASFMTEQRTKEIGIRKVLGAPLSRIILLLSADFTKWVLAANIIAWPLAYFAIGKWLENFAYRTSLNMSIFILSGVLALVTALLTVSYQTLKAALANPVESLRYE